MKKKILAISLMFWAFYVDAQNANVSATNTFLNRQNFNNGIWLGGDEGPNIRTNGSLFSEKFIGFSDLGNSTFDYIGYSNNVFFFKNAYASNNDLWWNASSSGTQKDEPAVALSGGLFLSAGLLSYTGGTSLDEQFYDTDQFIAFFDSDGDWGADMIAYQNNTFTFAPINTTNTNLENNNPTVEVLGKAFFNDNVAIGTKVLSGNHRLRVEGSIGAREIKVEAFPNWSDFVFDKCYELPTLVEVEEHIKETGHLKDIPSAEEVKKDGIYLGQMDAKLLQKIEELTLYLIEQNKEIQELKKEVSALKKG